MNYRLFSFLMFILISNLFCIKYSLSGSLPAHIKTISIPLINNETAEYGVSEKLTNIIINRFNEEGILNVRSNDKVDSKLIGLIKNILPSIDISQFWQLAISGIIILVAIIINNKNDKSKEKIILSERY